MSSDLYPIPVVFIRGQQPDAEFLNAWAAQIDRAFTTVSSLLSGFNGGAGNTPNALASLSGALGEMGFINGRLPRGLLRSDGVSKPWVTESLSAAAGENEVLLAFTPEADEATEATKITDSGLGTAQLKGADFATENIGTPGLWCLDGRRVLTSSAIEATDTVDYQIDTSEEKYRDAFGPFSGPNIVPGIYEVYQDALLCTISDAGSVNEYYITFPEVRRIANPYLTADITESIELSPGSGGVEWTGEVPKWPIPPYIYTEAVSNGGEMPTGRADLWFRSGTPPGATTLSRVIPPVGENIRFGVDPTNLNRIKIIVPEGTVLPHGVGEEGQYIVAFAGTSIAEAIAHIHGMVLDHNHDTGLSDRTVDADSLSRRFNPANYSHGKDRDDLFPQYLSRKGYDDTDLINRRNAMLGDLLIGASTSAPDETTEEPSNLGVDSHKLIWGHNALGPEAYFKFDDTEYTWSESFFGKLVLTRAPLRIDQGYLHLGSDGSSVAMRKATFNSLPALHVYTGEGDTESEETFLGSPFTSTRELFLCENEVSPEVNFAKIAFGGVTGPYRNIDFAGNISGGSVGVNLNLGTSGRVTVGSINEVGEIKATKTRSKAYTVANAKILDIGINDWATQDIEVYGPINNLYPNYPWLRMWEGTLANTGLGIRLLDDLTTESAGQRDGDAIGFLWQLDIPQEGTEWNVSGDLINLQVLPLLQVSTGGAGTTIRRAFAKLISTETFGEPSPGRLSFSGGVSAPTVEDADTQTLAAGTMGDTPWVSMASGEKRNSYSVLFVIECTRNATYEHTVDFLGIAVQHFQGYI